MKFLQISILFLLSFAIHACQKEETPVDDPKVEQPGLPSGNFKADRSGVFQSQNGYKAAGTAQIGTDEAGKQWLRFGTDFDASLSTGAVTVYVSQNQNLLLSNTSTYRRLDLVKKPGEHHFKIEPSVGLDFKFAILWCASAGVQFGNSELK